MVIWYNMEMFHELLFSLSWLSCKVHVLSTPGIHGWIDSVPEPTRISQKSSDVHAAESETTQKNASMSLQNFGCHALNWVILKRKNMEKLVTGWWKPWKPGFFHSCTTRVPIPFGSSWLCSAPDPPCLRKPGSGRVTFTTITTLW